MTYTTERPPTLTLTDFLFARIAEDEERADRTHLTDCVIDYIDGGRGCSCVIPARVLAECEAKRRTVDWAAPLVSGVRHENEDGRDLLCLLALPYADHVDYRPEWRP